MFFARAEARLTLRAQCSRVFFARAEARLTLRAHLCALDASCVQPVSCRKHTDVNTHTHSLTHAGVHTRHHTAFTTAVFHPPYLTPGHPAPSGRVCSGKGVVAPYRNADRQKAVNRVASKYGTGTGTAYKDGVAGAGSVYLHNYGQYDNQ